MYSSRQTIALQRERGAYREEIFDPIRNNLGLARVLPSTGM